MAVHHWTIVCQKVLMDDQNNISLIEIVEELTLHKALPEIPPSSRFTIDFPCSIVTLWTRSVGPEKQDCRIVFRAPNRKDHVALEYQLDLTNNQRMRILSRMTAFPI